MSTPPHGPPSDPDPEPGPPSSGPPGHLPPERLYAPVLDPEAQAHIDQCIPCQLDRELDLDSGPRPSTTTTETARNTTETPVARAGYAPLYVLGRGPTRVVYAVQPPDREGDLRVLHVVIGGDTPTALESRANRLKRPIPGVVAVETVVPLPHGTGIVVPWVDAPTLASLPLVHRLTGDALTAIVTQLATALAELHAAGLAHGALRSSNVFLRPDRATVDVLLTDAGFVPATPAHDLEALAELCEVLAGDDEDLDWVEGFAERCRAAETAEGLADTLPSVGDDALRGVAQAARELQDGWSGVDAANPRRYRRHRVIGRGAFGVVYRAWDTLFRCDVAIKILPERSGALRGEFERVRRLLHPNLATMYRLVDGPTPFLVMQLVHGAALDPRVHRNLVRPIGAQLFAGLVALHAADLIHRDLSLKNLMMEPGGRLAIVDFGLTRPATGAPRAMDGTPGYRAPEVRAGLPPTPKVDIYAAGIALFELARGARWRREDAPDRARIDTECQDPIVAALVAQCVATAPEHRPTAADAFERLAAFAPGPIPLLPRGEVEFVGRFEDADRLRAELRPGAIVRIVGEPGLGKTRFITQWLRTRVEGGRCDPLVAVAFNGFHLAFETLRVHRPRGDEGDAVLQPLAEVFLEKWRDNGSPLWIDDVQWMDADSLALLRLLLLTEDRPPLVLTHRPLPPDHPLAEPRFESLAPPWRLAPLSPAEMDDLRRELGLVAPPDAVARCAGNPLRLEQLARRGVDREHDLVAGLPPAEAAVARGLLATLAVHGGPVPQAVLSAACPSDHFAQVFHSLVNTGVVVFATLDTIDFVHDGERDVADAQIEATARPALHRSLATAFEGPFQRDAAALARHWAGAGELGRAYGPALEAAAKVERADAWARAVDFYTIALRHDPKPPPDLARRMAEAFANAGYSERAARLLDTSPDSRDLALAAELFYAAGLLPAGDAALDRALRVERMPPFGARSTDLLVGLWESGWGAVAPLRLARRKSAVHARRAELLWAITAALGQFDAVRTFRYSERHLRDSFRSGEPALAARALALQALYLDGFGASEGRIARRDRAVDLLVGDDGPGNGWKEGTRGYRKMMRGELLQALAHFERAEEHYRAAGTSRWERTALRLHHLYTLLFAGRIIEARAMYESLAAALRARGDRMNAAALDAWAGVLLALADDDPELAEARRVAAAAVLPPRALSFGFLMFVGHAQLCLYRGDREEAAAAVAYARRSVPLVEMYRATRAELAFHEGLASTDPEVCARIARRLGRVPTVFARLRAGALSVGTSEDAARAARRLAEHAGAADFADAAALAFEPPAVVFARAQARGVRAPARWLAMFGAAAAREVYTAA